MDGTEGLIRGQPVLDTGSPIRIPVGPETLGRIMNVIGEFAHLNIFSLLTPVKFLVIFLEIFWRYIILVLSIIFWVIHAPNSWMVSYIAIFNNLFLRWFTGEPIDERGPIVTDKFAAIHAEAPEFVEMNVAQEILITGIKVVDLLAPYAKGGKIGKLKFKNRIRA